jgi:TonB family protein
MKRLVLAAVVTSVLSANASAQETDPVQQGQIKFASCAKPQYPAAALGERRSGVVKAMFKVARDGTVSGTRIAQSSGHRDLDQAVQEALSKCTFTPTMVDGQPKEDWIPVQYVWTLD